jgi:hypothetical protein
MDSSRKDTVVWTRDSSVREFGVGLAGSSDAPKAQLTVPAGSTVEFCWSLKNANGVYLRHLSGDTEDNADDVLVLYTTSQGEQLPSSQQLQVRSPGKYRLHSGLVWTAENWCVAGLAKDITLALASQPVPKIFAERFTQWAFIIAHRLSVVRQVDRILFLRDGRIEESGPFSALSRSDGPFGAFYRAQFGERAVATGQPMDAPS